MKGREFIESKWVQDAKNPATQKQIKDKFPLWQSRVKNANLLAKAQELWGYFSRGESSGGDKLLVAGALLYLISPIDLVPDVIPVVGWLDDIGVAGYVLAFISGKISEKEMNESICESKILGESLSSVADAKKNYDLGNSTMAYNLEDLKKSAEEMQDSAALESLLDIENASSFDLCKIAVVGRYSTGKSTLINALLGRELLPSKPIPTTKAVTYITKAETEAMFSVDSEGVITVHDELSALRSDDDVISSAVEINVQINQTLWNGGVSVVDTPGLEDPDMNIVQMTHEIIPQADAIVMVLDASVGMSRNEVDFISKLMTSDRERKLLLVLNRSDKVESASDLDQLKASVCDALKSAGVIHPKLYTVSARNALSGGDSGQFSAFKDALKAFLEDGITAERQRIQGERVDQVKGNLMVGCDRILELAAQNEQDRQQSIENFKNAKSELRQKLSQKKQIVLRTVENAEMVFNANWQSFKSKLKVKLHKLIDQSSLAELRTGTAVEDLVTETTKKFLEEELQKIHDELKVESDKVLLDARISIQEVDLPITSNYQESYFAKNKEILVPSMLVLTFPFLGMFAWLQVAAVGLLGRGVIDGLISGIAEHSGINKFRPKLKEEADQQLRKLFDEVDLKLKKHFSMITIDLSQSFERAFNEQAGYLISGANDFEDIDAEKYIRIKKELESFQ